MRGSLLAAVVALAACAPSVPEPSRPNVLLIVLDTTRRDHLTPYGYPLDTTPHLARLAEDALVFDDAVSPGSWTLPSHATLFTGLYPRDHRTNCESQTLEPVHTTLAEVLSAEGYRTVALSNNVWLSSASGLQQGFAEFHEVWRDHRGPQFDDDGARMTTDRALDWVDRHGGDAPFFMFLNYFEPHLPYRAPPPWDKRFADPDAPRAEVSRVRSWQHPREVGYLLGVPGQEITPEQFGWLEEQYDGEIGYLDTHLGRLFDGLRERGALDRTLVIVTSDHGEHFGEHGLMDHKMSLYEPLIHVPLILRYPGAAAPGRVSSPVQTNDVFPTVLALAGSDRAAPPGSRSLLAPGEGRRHTFAEFARPKIFLEMMARRFPGADYAGFDRSLRAVRGDGFKLIRPSKGEVELYDLRHDPDERRNLAPERPEVVERLGAVLEAFEAGEIPFFAEPAHPPVRTSAPEEP